MTSKVVLLGRPNVGKSTLFNRLIRSKRAITHDRPGITRDRMEGVVRTRNREAFVLVDTGGVTLASEDGRLVAEGPQGIRGFERDILDQARAALAEAALICLVVDGREGLTPFDEHLADYARRSGKPVLLVVNKVDGMEKEDKMLAEFHGLGFPLLAVSAEHGHNVRVLEEEIRDRLPQAEDPVAPDEPEVLEEVGERDGEVSVDFAQGEDVTAQTQDPEGQEGTEAPGQGKPAPASPEEPAMLYPSRKDAPDAPLKLCMLGKPNAGKSSLINALLGEKRMIVSDVAGTTRDSVDIPFRVGPRNYTFVDTAGVRRRTKITDSVERFSVNSSLKSTSKAHVTLLVIDAMEGLTAQDKRLIELLDQRKTPFMILLNKMDLVQPRERKGVQKELTQALAYCPHIPVLPVSAVNRYGLKDILPMAERIYEECGLRVSTGQLNRAMEESLARHQAPVVRRVRPKFFYLTQAESQPPTFVFFVNDADRVAESYVRYLEKSLRRIFNIKHAPMRLNLRSSHKKK